MFLLVASFFAGVLTSLAPCILPLLPVVVGSSVAGGANKKKDRWKPYIISFSLAISVILFTLLLKVSTVLIGIDPSVWLYISGGIVILLGINLYFPNLWVQISSRIGFEIGSNKLLGKAARRSGFGGAILTGAALGPVFSSCSPVYALVLATVLPVNLALGLVYMTAYALGLGLALLAIALAGRKVIAKLKWAVNPSGVFHKILAIILVLVGLMIITGYDKKFQTWVAPYLPFDVSNIEQQLLPSGQNTATSTTPDGSKTTFNVRPYDAPELTGLSDWINSNPTTLAALKGKVVLIDFWTYSCINCQRTQPYLNAWYDKYQKDGFVIIGVHAPEFAFEKVPANVRQGVKDAGIKYPVALDNDFATWNAYKNQFWPAKYLIDKEGQVRFTHFGEGEYDKTEEAIQTLLKETGKTISASVNKDNGTAPVNDGQSPETYVGYKRAERFANNDQFQADKTVNYSLANNLPEHGWSLGGEWQINGLQAVSKSDTSKLRYNFSAKEVYLVMGGPTDRPVTLTLNGKPVTASNSGGSDVDANGQIHLNGARLYKLIKLPDLARNQQLELNIPNGVSVNAFTFGG
jgi:cytochrome c biogenesis protein CcdA/thiol-disulfide isomerase/thioredoxin